MASAQLDFCNGSLLKTLIMKMKILFFLLLLIVFQALTALLVQFDHELTESELQLAFVKSLRFDKFICSKLQPLGLIPNELSKQFMSIAESHSNLFPNMRCFRLVVNTILLQ